MIGIGVYGANGHQIHQSVADLRGARLAACCSLPAAEQIPGVRVHADLAGLLSDPAVDLVSICAPVRAAQGQVIRQALVAGKHVYAEKPCVMDAAELDECVLLARRARREFFEMAGTALEEPYATARAVVLSGVLGEIVQVTAQKSYPMADWRPQDEDLDGGLILQNGIHAVRMIEHVSGLAVRAVAALDTGLGNPGAGGLRTAAAFLFRLENGAPASAAANYFNQPGYGLWGYEWVRIFGSRGLLETDPKRGVRLYTGAEEREIPCGQPDSYLQRVVDFLSGQAPRPFPLEVELHPTRVVLAARYSASRGGAWVEVPPLAG